MKVNPVLESIAREVARLINHNKGCTTAVPDRNNAFDVIRHDEDGATTLDHAQLSMVIGGKRYILALFQP